MPQEIRDRFQGLSLRHRAGGPRVPNGMTSAMRRRDVGASEGARDDVCDWCEGQSYILEEKTPLERMIREFYEDDDKEPKGFE